MWKSTLCIKMAIESHYRSFTTRRGVIPKLLLQLKGGKLRLMEGKYFKRREKHALCSWKRNFVNSGIPHHQVMHCGNNVNYYLNDLYYINYVFIMYLYIVIVYYISYLSYLLQSIVNSLMAGNVLLLFEFYHLYLIGLQNICDWMVELRSNSKS